MCHICTMLYHIRVSHHLLEQLCGGHTHIGGMWRTYIQTYIGEVSNVAAETIQYTQATMAGHVQSPELVTSPLGEYSLQTLPVCTCGHTYVHLH